MENSKKDLDTSSFQSSTEMLFLEQVKECRHHLHCMEKLFFDLHKVPESDKEFEKLHASLNDLNQSISKQNNSSSSFPDLQSLMQEFETKLNSNQNLLKENESARSKKEESVHIQVDAVNNDISSPLTFVIQVPNSILGLLNRKISNDHLLKFSNQSSTKKLLKLQRKARFSLLFQRLFRRKKNNTLPSVNTNIFPNLEHLQLLREKNEENIANSYESTNSHLNYKSVAKNSHFTDKSSVSQNLTCTEIDSKLGDPKEKQTLVIPITYNFDEKSSTIVKPNLTIQLETIPQNDSKAYSNCIKITNEIPVQCINKSPDILEKEAETSEVKVLPKKDIQPAEMLLESLITTLLKTTERLNSLETLKTLVENLSEKESKIKKKNKSSKNNEVKDNNESKSLNHFVQRIMGDAENQINEPKPLEKKIPKRHSSKLSICSSSGSVSSDEDPYRSPMILRPKHIQRRPRCNSPSMLNYLVCQSERDIDQKVNSIK